MPLPPWFKLLKQWQDANRFGLTVPFIYGALDKWPASPLGAHKTPQEKFGELICSIASGTPDGDTIRLFTCGTVRDLTLAPVFGTLDYCVPIAPPNGSRPTLWVQQGIVPADGQTCDELTNALWVRYGQAITEGRFSLSNGSFGPFTEADSRLIELAIARSEDDA